LTAQLTAARIKELATVEGVRDNQLIGYGLVVGLNGTGDKRQTFFSTQTLANVLDRMGVQISPQAILVRNTAAVLITANLPPFGQPGSRLDVTVAAIGDATNLQGGLLIVTPLKGLDAQVYAVAQGAVVTGGFAAKGGGGNSATLNHPTAGRIPAGAIIERPAPSVAPAASVRLQLRQADFTTASRITGAINQRFPGAAKAANSGLVEAAIPADWSERRVEFLAEIEGLAVNADRVAKIIVNERSGTIVLGKEVKLAPVAILHGALSIEIQTTFEVSQPAPLNESGKTVVVPETKVNVKEEKAKSLILKEGATVEDLVRSLQSIGATARDIIAILQNLRSAGAIEAELEVI
jgi:flagellar P-ring protein precursor FlgI